MLTLRESVQEHRAFRGATSESSEELKELVASVGQGIKTEQQLAEQIGDLREGKARLEESLRLRDVEALKHHAEVSGLKDTEKTLHQESDNLRDEMTGLRTKIAAQAKTAEHEEGIHSIRDGQREILESLETMVASHNEAFCRWGNESGVRQQELDSVRIQFEAAKEELQMTKSRLEDTNSQLSFTNEQHDAIKVQLDSTKDLLDATSVQLDDTKESLTRSTDT